MVAKRSWSLCFAVQLFTLILDDEDNQQERGEGEGQDSQGEGDGDKEAAGKWPWYVPWISLLSYSAVPL